MFPVSGHPISSSFQAHPPHSSCCIHMPTLWPLLALLDIRSLDSAEESTSRVRFASRKGQNEAGAVGPAPRRGWETALALNSLQTGRSAEWAITAVWGAGPSLLPDPEVCMLHLRVRNWKARDGIRMRCGSRGTRSGGWTGKLWKATGEAASSQGAVSQHVKRSQDLSEF